MPDWPASVAAARMQAPLFTDSNFKDLTASATANTKGSYVELITSLDFNADALLVMRGSGTSTVGDFLADIAIGAAASETILIPNLLFGSKNMADYAIFPIAVKEATRISARVQSSDASLVARLGVYPLQGGFFASSPLGRVTAYGPNTADSGGIGLDPGGTANTKGSWAVIDAAIANPIRWAVLAFANQNNATIGGDADFRVDIGVGAAASESVVLPDLELRSTSAMDQVAPAWISLPLAVKAGERLAARCQSGGTDATDRLIDIAVYGID